MDRGICRAGRWSKPEANRVMRSSTFTSCILPSETWINEGMLPAQINLRVHPHGSFGLAKMCPRKHFER